MHDPSVKSYFKMLTLLFLSLFIAISSTDYCYETRVCQDYNGGVKEEFIIRVNKAISNSCLSIRRRFLGQRIPSGTYQIFPFGNSTGVDVYCDMTTDGGGWTLISQVTGNVYNKINLPSPLTSWLAMDKNYFLKTSAVGRLRSLLKFKQIRFKCSKPSSGKQLDLASSKNTLGSQVVRYFTGEMAVGTFPKACGSFDVLPSDDSTLSQICSQWGRVSGSYLKGTWGHDGIAMETRLINHPLFRQYHNHFLLAQTRWECDDVAVNVKPKSEDYWKLFVR